MANGHSKHQYAAGLGGGPGTDVLTGGEGKDTFMFKTLADFGTGTTLDEIMDFASGDKINLKAIDPGPALAGNQSFTFIGAANFTSAPHSTYELCCKAESAGIFRVTGDVNFDAVTDFAFLVHAQILGATDFVL